jgi:hypothetical protein
MPQCDKTAVMPSILSLEKQVLRKIRDYDFIIDRRYEDIRIMCKKPIVSWDENEEAELKILEKNIMESINHYEIKKRLLLDLILPINNN